MGTVRYTAGKDGFRIPEGDHIPTGVTGHNSAPAAPAPAPVAAPVQPVAVPQTVDYDYDYEPVDPSFNPFVNPLDASHQQAGLLAGHLAGGQRQQPRPVQRTLPVQQIQATTQSAPRFFPPGNLKLNRFESGFNFDFSSQ